MHSEYAVEPAAIGADWQTFRFLIEKFGLDKGRLISRLPKKWENKVIQAAKESGVSPIKLSSMVERLKNTSRLRVADFGREYQSDQTWIENAIREHADRPFRAIICAGEDRPCVEALGADDCSDDHALLVAPISKDIPRTADAIANALAFLAITAREIDLVDPFFDLRAAGADYVGPLAALLARLSAFHASCQVIRVHFRTHNSRPPEDIFLRDLPRQTNGIIPAGFSLQFVEWAELQGGEDFHDRFLLTDAGGLMLGAGFSADSADETVAITLLDDRHAQTIRNRFSDDTHVYEKVGSTVQIDSDGNASII